MGLSILAQNLNFIQWGLPYKILPHYTYADYCQWEGRWELIEGIPHSMSPAPDMRHQWVSANMIAELRACLKFIQWIPYATFWLQLR